MSMLIPIGVAALLSDQLIAPVNEYIKNQIQQREHLINVGRTSIDLVVMFKITIIPFSIRSMTQTTKEIETYLA
ncbi:hypothetical protein [Psychrobacillus sp. MER TA 171]|uniref:hypothetical protein n=1 Tax=Psychrobacillus sp. MER TA 171 TaxID=2939577 RepID=UPI00203D6C2A|nr:hypothetical protein [Psychrobacillus sp. MER TA 171]